MKNYFTGIDHPALACDDSVKLTDWYCRVLGYEIMAQTDNNTFIIKAPDGTFIEMMPKDGSERPQRNVCTPGMSHLALRVSDLDKAVEALDKAGVKWMGDATGAVGGGKLRSFYDPEGNMLQVVCRG